jgi:hypothetical protein
VAEQRMPNQGASPADPPTQSMTPAQQAAAASYGPNGEPNLSCIPGQPCPQAPNGYAQHQPSTFHSSFAIDAETPSIIPGE